MSGVKRDCTCPRARHEHGTWHAYCNDGCGCPPCRTAWAEYTRQRRLRIAQAMWARQPLYVPPHGTARRLQALAVIGYGANEIARLLGKPSCVVQQWRDQTHAWLYRDSARVVAELFDQLWDQPSADRYALKTRNLAARKGWAAALAWDDDTIDDPTATPATPAAVAVLDEIAVERYMTGTLQHPVNRNHSLELIEAVRRMAPHHSDAEIGRRVGISGEAVAKLRERNRIPSPRTVTRRETAA